MFPDPKSKQIAPQNQNQDWRPWTYHSFTTEQQDSHKPQASPPPYSKSSPFDEPIGNQNVYNFPETNPFRSRVEETPQSEYLAQYQHHSNENQYPRREFTAQNQHRNEYAGQHLAPQPASSRPISPSSIEISSQTATLTDNNVLIQALEFTHHLNQLSQGSRLFKPIIIPQTSPGLTSSFLRCYPPSLSSTLSIADFLAFVDNLNIVSTASPPLQVLNLAGSAIGLVPYHWAMIAGTATQAVAQLGTAAVSKGRKELFLKEVNARVFGPRGLKVTIVKTAAMREACGITFGSPMMGTDGSSMAEKVLDAVRGYVADLSFDVPQVAEQSTWLAKISAQQAKAKEKKINEKFLKEQWKRDEKDEKREKKVAKKNKGKKRKGKKHKKEVDSPSDSDSYSSRHDARDEDLHASTRRKEAHNDKIGKEERKAEAKAGKLLWILIENL